MSTLASSQNTVGFNSAFELQGTATATVRNKQERLPPTFSNTQFLVNFLVGPSGNPTPFIVYKEVACYNSPVLDAALNSEFIEGQTQTYRLEDTTPRAFRFVLQWMHNQRLTTFIGGEQIGRTDLISAEPPYYDDVSPSSSIEDFIRVEITALTETWVLADRLCLPRLQNECIRILDSVAAEYMQQTVACLHYVYDNTGPGSQLRDFFVHNMTFFSLEAGIDLLSMYTDDANAFPQQMLIDMMLWQNQAAVGKTAAEFVIDVTKYFVEE